jgi:hypothetical protein
MKPELTEQLLRDYPALFAGQESSKYIACDDGWFKLIEHFCHLAAKQHAVTFVQIKEKFGGLRLYYDGGDDYLRGAARLAESISYVTCEQCGNAGTANKSGWIKTLCEPCREGLAR